MKIPQFKNNKELFTWLQENKDILILEKKATIKHADTINCVFTGSNNEAVKTIKQAQEDNENEIKRTVIINTTNYMDSHLDVHIPGLWSKSLNENKRIVFLQEHKMQFDKVIAKGEDLTAYTKTFNWSELGFNVPGQTEGLTFDVNIKATKNKEMFELYKNNEVDNHSVGMQYVKIVLAINDEDAGAEWEAWNKYFPMVINQDEAEKRGFFWAVTEAKIIEGSAVLIGSNPITPTLPKNKPEEKQENKQTNEQTIALIERLKIYEPNFSLENLKDDNKPQPKSNNNYLLI